MDSKRFAIAVSFPGEHRRFVRNVVDRLAEELGRDRIFFDEWYESELLGQDGDLKLRQIYRDESEFVVPFFSEHFKKPWCKIEWSATRAMLLELHEEDCVLPVQMDLSSIPGWEAIDFAISRKRGARLRTGREIAEVLLEAYRQRTKSLAPQASPEASTHTGKSQQDNQQSSETRANTPPPIDEIEISRIAKYAPPELIGRENETALLNEAWDKVQGQQSGRPHVLTFVALGGEGKTSLVSKWVAELAARDWRGCESVFAWSFYSQGTREQTAVSSDLFLAEALKFFGDSETAGSAQGAFEKGRRLAQLIGKRQSLLILDGLEPLQYAPGPPLDGQLKDQGISELLRGLATTSQGLCVVTTRFSVPDLKNFWQTTAPEVKLLRLSEEAGVALLRSLDVKGTQDEYEELVSDVKGHALTLNLLGSYLRDFHGGDIRHRDLIRLEEADAEEQSGHAFRVMDAYVESFETGGKTKQQKQRGHQALSILQLLGLFDRPATADCLNALWTGDPIPGLTDSLVNLSETERNGALTRLESARLLTVNRDGSRQLVSLDTHPLIREYFAQQLRGSNPNETSAVWRAAHRRLYEHLCETINEGDQPTLEELQPLYQAVAHGCHAALVQEACDNVYIARILRQTEFYSSKKLGAVGSNLGAVACFFDSPWGQLSKNLTATGQANTVSEAAFYLRASGRLRESLEPLRAGLEMRVKQEIWKSAAAQASNLSELELTLGEVSGALSDAELSVAYADRSGDAFLRMVGRGIHANALHQSGRRSEAESLFREAEQMQAERQPAYPLLYSAGGFQYCDLLLAPAEREAWREGLGLRAKGQGHEQSEALGSEPSALSLSDVTDRATQTLKIAEDNNLSLLTIALDHLTLSRAALYESLLSGSEISDSASPISHLSSEIEAAVSGLHRSGRTDILPLGLLTRAWQRSLLVRTTGTDSAQSDLNEAWEIASRGPMPLFMADIHLHRARLFGRRKDEGGRMEDAEYPWKSVEHDLTEARRLIEKHGYGRRLEELQDAEESLLERVAGEQAQQLARITFQEGQKEEHDHMSRPRVFISYSHDSDEHQKRVLGLSERLRQDGVDTILDQYVEGSPTEGWPRWVLNGLDAATHVLCVCTESYYRRFRGHEVAGKGRGVDWEGASITQSLYEARSATCRFIPVLYAEADEPHIPEPLRGQTFHLLDSEANYQSLYDQLLGQAGVAPGELGELKTRSRESGEPATFGEPSKPPAAEPAPAASGEESPALKLWREKLDFLLVEEAVSSDAGVRFALKHRIDEARQKIRELEGDS